MKKLKVLSLVALSCLLLSGCGSELEKGGRFVVVDTVQDVSDGHVYIIKDIETGVNYIYIKASYISGISPLYDSNGEIIIDKED